MTNSFSVTELLERDNNYLQKKSRKSDLLAILTKQVVSELVLDLLGRTKNTVRIPFAQRPPDLSFVDDQPNESRTVNTNEMVDRIFRSERSWRRNMMEKSLM